MGLELLLEVQRDIAAAVDEAGGAEVFFGGCVNADGKVAGVEVLARGDADEVPAMLAALDLYDVVIHNHPGGDVRPSKADLAVAAEVGRQGKGFAIVDNRAARMYVVVEPPRCAETVPVDGAAVRAFFAPGGPLARAVEGFESRPGQVDMALAAADAFNAQKVCAVEAGTGSGKSFAYLVPAIMFAVGNRARVIVTTGTITLQEQLVHRDLPVLARAFRLARGTDEAPFHYAHLKGRGNYVCRLRVNELAADEALRTVALEDERDAEALGAVLAWAAASTEGSLSDMPFAVRPPVWELVQSDGDRCGGTGCPEFKTCAYWRARLDAARAAILVVNHHLFFADLAVRRQTGDYRTAFVLPGWQRVVLDEAHDLEDAASSFFGVTLTRRGILRRLGRLRSRQNAERGTFPALCRKLMKLGEATLAAHIQGVVMPAVEGAGARVESLFSRIEEAIEPLAGVENAALRYRGEDTPWNGLFAACRETARRIKELRDGVKKVQAPLIDRADENTALAPAVLEVHAVCRRLESLEKDLEFFADADDPDQVRWIEMRRSRGAPYAVCRSAPFLVGPQLEESLWRPVPTCILTSATLSVDGGFAYLASRLGLDRLGPARFRFLTIPSPFDWKRQAVLLVPTDMQDVGTDLFREDLARWIIDAVRITRGRAFVLFTSYGMLGRAHDDVCETLEGMGLDVLRQGMAPRSLLLEEFRRSGKAVLFGTESFWQGVDVRGEALSCVIIARLPFAVPTEPLQMARMEEVKARGRDAFREFSLPQAVLKLRQGVGRLLRAVGDRGAVIVLDRRIAARSYGRTFLQSLPPMRRVLGEGADLKDALSAFFNGAANGGASRCCS